MKNLTKSILIGFVLGLIIGCLINILDFNESYKLIFIDLFSFGGEVFLRVIKMLVVPIVFFSLTTGVANLNELSTLGTIGLKSIFLYIFTTFLAISGSLIIANKINPGENFKLSITDKNFNLTEPPLLKDVLLNILPNNPFESLVNGNMLQIIFFSILIGSAISLTNSKSVKNFFNDFN